MMYTPHHQSLKAFQLDLSTGEIPILDAGASVRNASRLSGIVEDQKWQLSSLALRDQSPLHGSEISINVIRPGMYYVSYIISCIYIKHLTTWHNLATSSQELKIRRYLALVANIMSLVAPFRDRMGQRHQC